MISFIVAMALAAQGTGDVPERGISEALARERAAAIGNLRYELAFVIPSSVKEPVQGRVVLRFTLQSAAQVVLDFAQPRERVRTVRAGGAETPFRFENGHLAIPAAAMRAGENEITIEFLAGEDSLNRSEDVLYTLFVPARAHLAFPSFDQPNLKARYTLSLTVPPGWQAVANGAERERSGGTIHFVETAPLPTYLFGFVAGAFSIEKDVRHGREFRMFHRETDPARLARNRDVMFDLHASSLAWLEDYTGVGYPWGKFDFVMIPAFQFTGMEHAAAILYNASLFLDQSATQQQQLGRATTIAHETAHMWFGNLVTMEWFSDVWMKEVFANFMAAKIVNPAFPELNHDLRFLLAHYPGAYDVDRTAGTNAIRQPLANLSEAGQMYGAIIYLKAPIMMRQLELMLGAEALRDGLREYLKKYAFGNATWLDLVAILDARTPEDLAAWSRAWVEERGRPLFTTTLRAGTRGITELTLEARDPLRRGLVWPQRLEVALGYRGRVEKVPVTVSGTSTRVDAALGKPRPLYVLPSGGGLGYGLFVLDRDSRDHLLAHLDEIPDALTRGSAWVTLWENVVEQQVPARAFVDLVLRAAPRERDEQNRQRILSYLVRAYWRFLPANERERRAPALESMLRAGIDSAATSSQKSAWFNAYRDVALTRPSLEWLERVWRREEKVEGLAFAETDEIAMALELAVREVPRWEEILRLQHERTQNPDRKARMAFVMPALSADPSTRDRAFARFRQVENRRREPWVEESLAYLNHPLREEHARQFVAPGLELLQEIQRTGDIFFPTRWTNALLGGHRSREVASTVESFLARELQYPQRLRWTILTAADDLFRGAR
jgi:aminopeptidase N